MAESLLPMLGVLVTSLPVFLVEIAVIVLAVSRWNRHPKVSMLAATAMGIMLVVELISRTASVLLPMRLMGEGRSAAELGVVFAVIGGISALTHAVALGLLAGAIFSERGPARPQV